MRRILIVDDQEPGFAQEIRSDVLDEDGGSSYLEHLNPSDFLGGGEDSSKAVSDMLLRVGNLADEYWDVVAIDLFLGEFGLSPKENLEIPLRAAESFRDRNQSAAMLLYSGTLSEYLKELFGKGASDTQLRRIFLANISNFVPRNRVAREVASAAKNPSWLLRLDRLLMRHSKMVVGPEEAKFKGRSFADLAMAVRRQDIDGQQITQLTAEHGISWLADLNS